jgi:predicted membrane-bound spermidine synthase
VISIILLASGKGAAWHEYNNLRQWKRMLPGGKFRGSFNTPQAKYLYGDYRGGFDVIRWDSICETLPNRELAIQTAAVNIVQNPTARRILVFGSGGLPLCGFLCSLEQVEQVVWMDSDSDYPTEVLKIAPVKFNKKLSVPAQDIRSFLGRTRQEFDLVIMLLPAPSSLSMNRYFSVNSYRLIKSCLAPGGVLSAGFPGGENYMGEELKFLGASLLKTLREVFPYVILKPGDSSRFFASRQKNLLSIKPEELEKRLSTIPQLASQLPPQALYTLYDPFRADFQMEIYQKTLKDSANRLLNSDTTPILSRFTMLYSGKKAGFELPTGLKEISPQTIFQTAAAVILLLTILRSLLYMLMRRRNYLPGGAVSRDMNFPVPDILFFVWITSVLAMAFNIILMFVFQIDKGALFLYFGLLNALFMLGMFIGSRAVEILQTLRVRGPFFLWLSLMTVGYVLLLIVRLPVSQFTCFFFLFFLAGLISGTWLPRAAFVLKQREQQHRSAALKLWLCDSLGGAVGGLLSAILLLPLLGLRLTLILLMCISIVMTALSMIFVFTNNPKGQI